MATTRDCVGSRVHHNSGQNLKTTTSDRRDQLTRRWWPPHPGPTERFPPKLPSTTYPPDTIPTRMCTIPTTKSNTTTPHTTPPSDTTDLCTHPKKEAGRCWNQRSTQRYFVRKCGQRSINVNMTGSGPSFPYIKTSEVKTWDDYRVSESNIRCHFTLLCHIKKYRELKSKPNTLLFGMTTGFYLVLTNYL